MDFKSARLISWDGRLPEVGEYLQTKKGSTYAVIGVKLNMRQDAKSIAKLQLLKLTPSEVAELTESAIIHGFQWCKK